ncbi:ATP-grasp domain-containing protein [Aldersonia sp. NBC_00410]|uniref:acetyl-CoA carboxylase family protein n=1 Tax=Aldersonia sp. NBC_00410 TaxID=2975954 RepID=UPI002250339E|nr:carboxyl transferase domain-containing protein [Aldersonia sp. NBC_00410]MCX5043847.1 ATP-grasp domain-containing protein [Aldersonia sp. NBC_00410]
MRLLIANRGEIALRIIRTARELDLETVAIYSEDDADSPHVRAADEAIALSGVGATAYLDIAAVCDAVKRCGADLVHPGYGFLSENAAFARAVTDAGAIFVGPGPDHLELFGDKAAARRCAVAAEVPVLPATDAPATVADIRAFFAAHPDGIMVKALAGGGGRGLRAVRTADAVEAAVRACATEAHAAFGSDAVFAEALVRRARHIEVQIASDGSTAIAIGDRDCSVQRRNQKVIEIAPAPHLDRDLRRAMHDAAINVCASTRYRGLATVEFLVTDTGFTFLEVNPRLQVEHTVTEAVTGIDLVAVGLRIALGDELTALELPRHTARGTAVQARVNMETMSADGSVIATTGTLQAFTPPTGPGVRVDTFGRVGLSPSPRFDSLLAKVIVHTPAESLATAARKADAALAEFVIDGVPTNLEFLRAILQDDEFRAGGVDTRFLDRRAADFAATVPHAEPMEHAVDLRPGEHALRASMAGTVFEIADEGAELAANAPVVVLEAMKMQHVLTVDAAARVLRVLVVPGQVVRPGEPLALYTMTGADTETDSAQADLDTIRPDLAEILHRHDVTLDKARPDAVAKVHARGRRTARENIADLVDEGSFVEYGPLAIAAQRARRTEEDLIANTPADGLVCGVATVGAAEFGAGAEVAVLSYDYSVLAGTQGARNHAKTDRILELAARKRVPLVFFPEGGGGRPGDTDIPPGASLDVPTFRAMAALQGRVPTVAIVSGRCFAGNAALAGVCDVLIATRDANIGMGGPAMISGGGLGEYRPEEIGPIDVQRSNGVVHVVASDEAHAVALAKQYLSYFQGSRTNWDAPDPRLARHVVPENRLRAYDVRRAIEAIADVGSVLELRRDYGVGIVTALVRVAGAPFGMVANSSHHLGGAIDAEAADKMADFVQLCESFRLPIVALCDTPGFMVGPETERTAAVRRFGRMFVTGARITVPYGMVILRKAYGLGAMAMAAGSLRAPDFTIAWPTGEIGAMGLEGAVRLGFRKELDAKTDHAERAQLFDQLVELAYQHGKALNAATNFELDDVIDPADTRTWIQRLTTAPR